MSAASISEWGSNTRWSRTHSESKPKLSASTAPSSTARRLAWPPKWGISNPNFMAEVSVTASASSSGDHSVGRAWRPQPGSPTTLRSTYTSRPRTMVRWMRPLVTRPS